jgi:hypothetical protein
MKSEWKEMLVRKCKVGGENNHFLFYFFIFFMLWLRACNIQKTMQQLHDLFQNTCNRWCFKLLQVFVLKCCMIFWSRLCNRSCFLDYASAAFSQWKDHAACCILFWSRPCNRPCISLMILLYPRNEKTLQNASYSFAWEYATDHASGLCICCIVSNKRTCNMLNPILVENMQHWSFWRIARMMLRSCRKWSINEACLSQFI